MPLEDQIVEVLQRLDVRVEPGRVAEGAHLLQELQRHAADGERLRRRVAAFAGDSRDASGGAPQRSLADWSYAVLRAAGKPLHYRDIALKIQEEGFRHSRPPKNPKQQLFDSVWTALYEDDRFIKTARGIWDLVEREP